MSLSDRIITERSLTCVACHTGELSGSRPRLGTTDLVGTNLADDAAYDQLAFFLNKTDREFTGRMGVVDFDDALSAHLYEKNERRFYKYVHYYIADYRPVAWSCKRRGLP